MSINSAASIAFNGMMATQIQLALTAANIANAGTVGYTDKSATQVSVVNNGTGAGTAISGITSNVDQFLMKLLVSSNTDLGSANITNNYLDQLQSLFGTTGSGSTAGTSLGNTLASLETAISTLSGTPNSGSLQANAVSALNAVFMQLNDTSTGIQKLRGNADQEIGTTVGTINQQLQLIGTLNRQIVQANAAGQSTADLADQQNTALQTVSSNMAVSYFRSSNGSLQVYTASGQSLVDNSVHTLSYTPAASVNATSSYCATPPSGFGAITLNGIDVTSQITSGTLGGLITLRDSALPTAQTQLDELASQLKTALNAVSNSAGAFPPPASLTGTATVSSGDALAATGTVRIAVADRTGALVSYQDLNLASYATVGGLVTAINGISGLSASINSSGNVVIASTDTGNGVAINEMSSAVGANGQGLSGWLGLNDLVTGSSASDIAVRSDIVTNPGLLQTATLSAAASPAVGGLVLSSGDTTASNNLYTALTGNTAFASVGGLGATSTSFAGYAADIIGAVATTATTASTNYTNKQTAQASFANTMASETGVNLDEETSRLSTLQNQYSAATELLQVINQMFSSLMTSIQSATG